MVRFGVALTLLAALCACHTMQFEVAEPPYGETVYERKSFYLWGLTPTRVVDGLEHCPAGVGGVKEETRFSDGLFQLLTLGIWSPRSSWYTCLPE